MRWLESSRARSALFSSRAIKLDQSDGKGTKGSFSIIQRTGRWRWLHLVLVPVLIDSCWYLSKTTSILPKFAPILKTVFVKVSAYWPKVAMSVGFPSAITSAWPSMSRQLGSTTVIFAGTSTCCVRMFAITDLFVECKLPLVVARDSGTAMSSCWRMFSKCTSRPALYAVMSLCRMFLSTLIVSCLPLQGCTTSYKKRRKMSSPCSYELVISDSSAGHYLRAHTGVWLQRPAFVHVRAILHWGENLESLGWLDRCSLCVRTILKYAMLLQWYNYPAFIRVVSLHSSLWAFIVCVLIFLVIWCEPQNHCCLRTYDVSQVKWQCPSVDCRWYPGDTYQASTLLSCGI